MNVLFVSAEVAPFAKTGGLGDVAGALPRYLGKNGHDVRVVVPMYQRVRTKDRQFEPVLGETVIDLGGTRVPFSVYSSKLPGTEVPVYFIHCPGLYDRPNIYTSDSDEHLRFCVLQHAALRLCQALQFAPDIVHANDWQTALLPLMLRTVYAWDRLFSRTRTVLTIHNIGHQGTFGAHVLPETGLAGAAGSFHQDHLREGRINFLLTGILYANVITTVSPTYAREIQTPEHGVGLDAFLRGRRDVLFGILNGIDEDEWSPERDQKIAVRYSVDTLEGKEENKRVLLRAGGLPYVDDVPLIGIVSRLVWQKGFDLCVDVLPGMLRHSRVQLVVLGTGEPKYEQFFGELARRFPKQVAYKRGFSEPLAHQIEAGADMFLMPSRYEPCGLNQLYSLRYGTVPIVHRTGGLADTVQLFNARTGTGNGVVFDHFNGEGLTFALKYALNLFGSGRGPDRARFQTVQRNAMSASHAWEERVGYYEALYRRIAPG